VVFPGSNIVVDGSVVLDRYLTAWVASKINSLTRTA
jgi:hypothetical protein